VPVGYISGADLRVRRSFVEQSGLFDERYEAYYEEVDLCARARTGGGLDVHFVPAAQITHLAGASYGRQGERRIRVQYASCRKYLAKHHGAAYALPVLFLSAWHYAVKGVIRCVRFTLAPGAQKETRRAEALAAWHHVRYSLRDRG
jgi:GT2 family glycosyltransferase